MMLSGSKSLLTIPSLVNVISRTVLAPVNPFEPCGAARFASDHRKKCAKDNSPRCSKESLDETGCKDDEKAAEKHAKTQSMWYNPACCNELCANAVPRFDELYYKPSDKAKRTYMITWKECPRLRIVRKPICKFEKIEAQEIKMKKRCPSVEKPKTACKPDESLLKCQNKPTGPSKCPRLTLPGCRPVRVPPYCSYVIRRSHCKKRCTPYPSFSECVRDLPAPRRPIECNCLDYPAMCDVWEALRKKYLSGKKQ